MLSLPESTEIKIIIPKKAVYEKFNIKYSKKKKFDEDIKRLTLTNQISKDTISVQEGEKIKSIYVLVVDLKKKKFDKSNLNFLNKLLDQNIIFLLRYEEEYKLAIYRTKLLETKWEKSMTLNLKGIDLDEIWRNVIIQIGNLDLEEENTIDEQIKVETEKKKIKRKIEKLEKRSWKEKQPKKQFELVKEIKKLEKELEEM